MLAGGRRARLTRQHPRQLDEALVGLDEPGGRHGSTPALCLGDGYLSVRESSHLGEVRDDEHLVAGERELVQ